MVRAEGCSLSQGRRRRSILGRIRSSPYLFVLPALAGLVFMVLYPFAFNIFIMFTNMSISHIRPCGDLFGPVTLSCYTINQNLFQNFSVIFTDPAFIQILENTIIWTFANVLPTVGLGLVLAFVLNSKVRGKTIYRLFMIVPWAMPSFITLLVWQGMYNYQYGVINSLLSEVGIPSINWLGDCTYAFVAIVIANIWLGYPFMMIIFSGALQSIPQELYEAASIDGATGFTRMRHITIPLIRPTIIIALLLGSIWTFNNFNSAYLITAGGPGLCTTIFITQAYNQAFGGFFHFAIAGTYAFVAFIILFVPGFFWSRYTGLTRGGAR